MLKKQPLTSIVLFYSISCSYYRCRLLLFPNRYSSGLFVLWLTETETHKSAQMLRKFDIFGWTIPLRMKCFCPLKVYIIMLLYNHYLTTGLITYRNTSCDNTPAASSLQLSHGPSLKLSRAAPGCGVSVTSRGRATCTMWVLTPEYIDRDSILLSECCVSDETLSWLTVVVKCPKYFSKYVLRKIV